jgi:hypothetical protein
MVTRAFNPDTDSLDQPLRFHRQEAFATLIAQGKQYTEAYRIAGYKPSSGNACMLAAKEHVKGRIERIRAKLAQRHEDEQRMLVKQRMLTVESIIDELDNAARLAVERGQVQAYVAAIKEKAVMAGLRIERSERGAPHEFSELSDADLIRELRDMGIRVEMDDGKTIEHEPS